MKTAMGNLKNNIVYYILFLIQIGAIVAAILYYISIGQSLLTLKIPFLIIEFILIFFPQLIFFIRMVRYQQEEKEWKQKLDDIMKQQSQESNVFTNEFVATASHNFRTPITGIKGYLDLLDKDEVFAEDRKAYVKKMQALVLRLSELVQNMLTVATKPQRAEMDFVAMIERIINEVSANAKAKNINILFNPPINTPHIMGDSRLLIIAFENIFNNAIKYGYNDTNIEVGITVNGNYLQTSIKNYGVGIPAEEIPTLFEKFHRAKNVLMTYEGSGLGLFITKQIINLHNGDITVNSVEHKDTTFIMSLPLN